MVLLAELLGDDIADLGLDLLARHLVERRQIDEVEQPLVKLDLEVGLGVALLEGAGVAGLHQPRIVGEDRRVRFRSIAAGLADVPHG